MLAMGENSQLIPLHRKTNKVFYNGEMIRCDFFMKRYGPKLALNIHSSTTLSTPDFYKLGLPSSLSSRVITYEDSAESQQSTSFKFRSHLSSNHNTEQRMVEAWLGSSNSS